MEEGSLLVGIYGSAPRGNRYCSPVNFYGSRMVQTTVALLPAAMSEPLYKIVGIDQSESRGNVGNKGFETRSRKGGEKRGNKTV